MRFELCSQFGLSFVYGVSMFVDFYSGTTNVMPLQLAPSGAPIWSVPGTSASVSDAASLTLSSSSRTQHGKRVEVRCSRCGHPSPNILGHDRHVEKSSCRGKGVYPIPESQYHAVSEAKRLKRMGEKELQRDYAEAVEDSYVSAWPAQPATCHLN